ncbi:extracellular solute-binding protein [Actinoplanes sp. NPDC051470]|uniref:ABC transporter substrate-binding protein n=1 Tax=unclassified Actinoplanes TaxID=2626549 RepID=UPI003414FF69
MPRARKLLAAVLMFPLVLGATACGGGEESKDGKVVLSFYWWGGETRAGLTEKALNLYTAEHPDVTFKKTWQANQGYFDKLATLTAGGDPPDVFQIDDNYLAEYADRKVTLDLTPYQADKRLDTSRFPEPLWKYGVVDGKMAGLSFGENTQGLVYDKTLLEKFKLPEPTMGMSWEDYIAWASTVTKTAKVPGTQDPSADFKAFWVWLRQQGKDLYQGKQLGFTEADVTQWFTLWQGARAAGATPTADVIHEGNSTDITKQLVATGKAATSFVWVNQMPELKKNVKGELGVTAYPGKTGAQWPRASMFFSVFRGSKHKDVAVDVINFLANDPEAGQILGTERGLPSNLDIREQVAAGTDNPAMKQSITVQDEIGKTYGAAPTVPPAGHSVVKSELIKAAEEVVYGRQTPDAAAKAFVAAATSAIGKG